MKSITEKEYCSITGRSPQISISDFTFEEVQDFLHSLGYNIIIHRGEAKVQSTTSDGCSGEVIRVGNPIAAIVEVVLAVKPGTELPTILDTEEAIDMRIWTVFQREIKHKLLSK